MERAPVLLPKVSDMPLEGTDVGRCAEPGLMPYLLAEELGQPLLELPVVLGEAGGSLVGGGKVGDEGVAADSWPAGG